MVAAPAAATMLANATREPPMSAGLPRPRPAVVFAVPVLVGLMLTLFAWPSARLAPRDLPLGVVGPVPDAFAAGGSFSVHRYADAAAARHGVRQRKVYGAVVGSSQGTTLYVASAASLLVAQLLEHAFAAPAASGPQARVVDVVPADPQDPRGAALASSVLPLVLAGIVAGFALGFGLRPGLTQAAGLVAASVLAGLVAIGIVQGWLGVLGGSWAENGGVLALTMLGISAAIAGLGTLIGLWGFLLGAGLMMVIGNPFSAVSSAPELLPKPVGVIGQLLPPGAGGNLLRSTAFFDGAGGAGHLAVLLAWAVLGLVAVCAGALRRRPTPPLRPGRGFPGRL